ncbi:M24 family metallopeptidase [Pelagibacterium lacus]|uniref:Aminopeptidase P family protein n=1 Tax=Pelagibacterium lacus TaxID=2282655 RepID=A0A369W5G9_9HYPH|nr:Xaa-Pro peptidase family protein [Pelagibacterium lacus]RDE09269.1 aminopeptidase P family protein [Pelagibacterium lacus]
MNAARPLPDRVRRIQAEMAERGIDATIVFKPENSFLLTGFNPIIYSHPVIAIVPAEGEPMMLVHALRDDHGRASAFVSDIRLYGAWSTKVTMGPNWLDALVSILGELGVASGRLALEEEFVPLQRYRQITERLSDADFVDASHFIDTVRLIKDPDQIEMARLAAKLADTGMDEAVRQIAQGVSEREISIQSMHAMNRYWTENLPDIEVADFGTLEGGAQNGLWTWTLVGDRMFFNCDNPTLRRPQRGEAVSVFIWANANGIHAENERTVAFGPLPDVNRRALDTILDIRETLRPMLRPGTRYADLFLATKAGLEKAGYPDNIPGRIGHGIGLGAHEHSSLDAKSELVLEPGMMFTLEPNLRVPGVCATQISDTILITDTGCEYLTQSRGGYIEV